MQEELVLTSSFISSFPMWLFVSLLEGRGGGCEAMFLWVGLLVGIAVRSAPKSVLPVLCIGAREIHVMPYHAYTFQLRFA